MPLPAPTIGTVSGIGVLLTVLVALIIGGVLGWWLSRNARRGQVATRMPGDTRAPGAAELAATALDQSTIGHVVADEHGHVRYANPRSVELSVVRAGMLDPRILAAVARASESGEPTEVELTPIVAGTDLGAAAPAVRRGRLAVQAVVRSVAGGLILVQAADETEALRVDAVRRDFVANVSHELKTPVAAITLLAEAIGDAVDEPATVARFAGRLTRESERLGAMVTELITLSRLQGADPLPELAVVEVDEVATAAAARSVTLAEGAGITLVLAPPSRALVLGDRQMLLTALGNLIDNAVHYSAAGTTVSISSAIRAGTVEIAVTDRGIGIAPELQDRVFERFFRIDPARSRATGGTGLGLAIVKHVAANHGGSAAVWSKPGTGSTFTLRLPVYRHVPARSAPAGPVPVAEQAMSGGEFVSSGPVESVNEGVR